MVDGENGVVVNREQNLQRGGRPPGDSNRTAEGLKGDFTVAIDNFLRGQIDQFHRAAKRTEFCGQYRGESFQAGQVIAAGIYCRPGGDEVDHLLASRVDPIEMGGKSIHPLISIGGL